MENQLELALELEKNMLELVSAAERTNFIKLYLCTINLFFEKKGFFILYSYMIILRKRLEYTFTPAQLYLRMLVTKHWKAFYLGA